MSNITLLTRLLSNIRSVVGLPDEIEQKVSAMTALTFASRETHQDMRAEAQTSGTWVKITVEVESGCVDLVGGGAAVAGA